MSFRSTLPPADFETLQLGVIAMFYGVAGSDGKVEEKEILAFAKEMMEAPLYKSSLAKEVFQSVATELNALLSKYKADQRNQLRHLTDVADVLDRGVTVGDRDDFKKALVTVAIKVAQASGGVFGFGDKISKDEKSAIGAIGIALRLV
jgi:uncharacterized tellurite resistance protein B-like protein